MQIKRRLIASLISSAVVLSMAPSQSMAMDVIEELKSCARINDQTSRSTCYEDLGSKVLNADLSSTVTVESTHAPAADKDFGKPSSKKRKTFSGKLVSCQKSVDSRWFFIFENDQVWKQVETDRRRFKDCDFQVKITRDTFGYKMQIDGENGKIRVKRIR